MNKMSFNAWKTLTLITALIALLMLAGCAAPGDAFEYAPEEVTEEDALRAGMDSIRTFAW